MTLTILLSLWFAWAASNLALMAFARPDFPCYNGFRIYVPARYLDTLTIVEYLAIYAHEDGHRHHRHVWKNFARVCFFIPSNRRRRLLQEFEADDYAAAQVSGLALASALRKLSTSPADLGRAARLESHHRVRVWEAERGLA